MPKEQDPYGVYGAGMETRKALENRIVKLRMKARRAAQSDAWEAILRIAGRDIDFELDDLVALEAKAPAEFDRTRAEARAAEEARAVEEARAADLPYEDLRNEIARVWREFAMRQHIISCPVCRKKREWRRSSIDERNKTVDRLEMPRLLFIGETWHD